MNHSHWMSLAIEQARAGIASGQSPFGAVVVRDGHLVRAGHNEVWKRTDPTAHAEVVAIQNACSALRTIDLSGCVMYTTCEPCPMCAAAIHWARLDECVFGATIADAATAGFNEMHLSIAEAYRIGRSPVRLTPGIMQRECADLFRQWAAAGGRRY